MNNEKVKEIKEIKELFKNCGFTQKHCGNCDLWKDEDCIETIKIKILTLINELESELEKEQINNLNCDTELQYKEKRIAELEKETKIKTDTIIDLLKKQEFYETEKLKQFATILKVKTVLTPAGWSVNIEDIEKTLKEVINYDIKSAKSKEIL